MPKQIIENIDIDSYFDEISLWYELDFNPDDFYFAEEANYATFKRDENPVFFEIPASALFPKLDS